VDEGSTARDGYDESITLQAEERLAYRSPAALKPGCDIFFYDSFARPEFARVNRFLDVTLDALAR
jgi:hypothetical protein